MQAVDVEARVLAQAIFEIRVLLAGYLGAANDGDLVVREAAHLAYALHNEALQVLEGKGFDVPAALAKVRAMDAMFGENYAARFESLVEKKP